MSYLKTRTKFAKLYILNQTYYRSSWDVSEWTNGYIVLLYIEYYCLYIIDTDNISCSWRMLLISWYYYLEFYIHMFTIEIKLLATIQENIKINIKWKK